MKSTAVAARRNLVAFVVGIIFAVGLAISGMTQPHKVIAFLDFTGDWDPSLMFVMIAAIAVHSSAYWLIRRRRAKPVFDSHFHDLGENKISTKLVAGAIIFGVGWGLGGCCPGPALASLGTLALRPAVFVLAMIAGMFIFRKLSPLMK